MGRNVFHEAKIRFNELDTEAAMDGDDFHELAGRIDAVYLAFGALVAELEDGGVMDGPHLAAELRRSAAARQTDTPSKAASARTLAQIAERLDEARRNRHR